MKLLVLFKAYVLPWKIDFDGGFCHHVFHLSFASPCSSSVFSLHQTVVHILSLGHQHLFRFFFPTLNFQNSVDGEVTNICSTSLALSALIVTWTFATLLRNWIAETSEEMLLKSVLCNMCGCLGDASEPHSSLNWRRNVKGFPFIPCLCFWWFNLLLCSSRIFSSAHNVSSVEAVLFGSESQQLKKNLKKKPKKNPPNASLLEKQGKVPQFLLV